MHIRPAEAGDAGFLLDMLLAACNWTGETRVTRDLVAGDAHLSGYLAGWPRSGDLGLVAVDEHGARLGAVWARAFTAEAPGYGFVAEDVPEVTMAVLAEHRGRGIGRRLLGELIEQALAAGWPALSLSVEDGNGVVALYRGFGFRVVGRYDNADTMLLELGR